MKPCVAALMTKPSAAQRSCQKGVQAKAAIRAEVMSWGLTDATIDPGEQLLLLVTRSAVHRLLQLRPFVNSPLHKETTPEWKVESREPVTISPAIECQAEREGQRCGFKGSAVQGKWINKEDEGE